MANRWEQTTDGYSFRFFSPEQVDEILRDGMRRGREGSHAAIERILKHEPGLQRSQLWQRIRVLKHPQGHEPRSHSVWSSEDEEILRAGYHAGWQGKRAAVRQLLKHHPDWRPHVIWQHARKSGLVQRTPKRGQERSRLTWTEEDDRMLLDLAGYKRVPVIARVLHRSEAAVRYHLTTLGKSSRVHVEGFVRSALASELHLSTRAIQRFIVEGLLEVRDPRITRESLDCLRQSGRLEAVRSDEVCPALNPAQEPRGDTAVAAAGSSNDPSSAEYSRTPLPRPSRAKRAWTEVAASLGISLRTVERLIVRSVLKLYDPTITENSVRHFCRRYGSFIEYDYLNQETREWLRSSMDWVPTSGEAASRRLAPLRKHARIVRRCVQCGRPVRGNAFFRHLKRCIESRRNPVGTRGGLDPVAKKNLIQVSTRPSQVHPIEIAEYEPALRKKLG